jgi:hypothetical protein
MRAVANLLAAVTLPLFMISTSISASVCDLSCWFIQTQSGCHTSSSHATANQMAMSMPADMDMGPGGSSNMTGRDAAATPSSKSVSMPAHMRMVTEQSGDTAKPETDGNSLPGHSKGASSCIHQTCAQVGTSGASFEPGRARPNSLHAMAIDVSISCYGRSHPSWLGPGSPPPRPFAVSSLTTTLRI